jgi:hypothetical protein
MTRKRLAGNDTGRVLSGLDMLSVVRGLEPFSIEQFRDQLHRKDLLQEQLSGDVLRKHEDEASKLNLQKIFDLARFRIRERSSSARARQWHHGVH